MIGILLKSLVATLVVEVPLSAVLGVRTRRGLATVVLMNLLTNPSAVFWITLARKFLPQTAVGGVTLALELAVLAIESFILYRCMQWSVGQSCATAGALNGASFCLGCLL